MMSKKTVFRKEWKEMQNFSPWLKEVASDRFSASCSLCNTVFYLSNMGKQALTSHMKSKKHQNAMKSQVMSHSLVSSLQPANRSISLPQSTPAEIVPVEKAEATSVKAVRSDLSSFLLGDNVHKAEIIWCLYTVAQHSSQNSAAKGVGLFPLMFPDSEIAKKMSLQRTKLSYTIVYGLAPYFSENLLATLKECRHIVVGFDESLNKVSQKQQMDISVRYWHPQKNEVSTQYFTSQFLGHTCAKDLIESFKTALSPVGLEKLVQVSMDGPNVNIKFLKDLNDELCVSPDTPQLLDLGTCGLHTLNCAFKSAITVTGWGVVTFLKAVYYLFKDVPARRADYTYFTGSTNFPKKFCYIRWIENSDVAKRALEILPHINKFVDCAIENKQRYCSCNNFQIVSQCLKEPLFGAKLAFFQSLAGFVEPFLTKFQSDLPLAPFLYEEINDMVQSLLQKFVQPSVLEGNLTCVYKIDVKNRDNLLPAENISLSYAVKDELRKIKKKKDSDISKMRQSCLKAFQSFIVKIFERSPIKFPLTKGVSFLDPKIFGQTAVERLSLCLKVLVSKKLISGLNADQIHEEFVKMTKDSMIIKYMESFKKEVRLDNHWIKIMEKYSVSKEFNSFVKLLLILSHGNAFLERGFSINSECVIDNLHEDSIVALRKVYGAIHEEGGVDSVKITKPMIHSVKLAHSRYMESVKRKKEERANSEKKEKIKKRVAEEVKCLQQKKLKIISEAHKEAAIIEDQIKILQT